MLRDLVVDLILLMCCRASVSGQLLYQLSHVQPRHFSLPTPSLWLELQEEDM
jgi:hypothetical protein